MPTRVEFEGLAGPCSVFMLSADNPDSIRGFGFVRPSGERKVKTLLLTEVGRTPRCSVISSGVPVRSIGNVTARQTCESFSISSPCDNITVEVTVRCRLPPSVGAHFAF